MLKKNITHLGLRGGKFLNLSGSTDKRNFVRLPKVCMYCSMYSVFVHGLLSLHYTLHIVQSHSIAQNYFILFETSVI